LRTQLKKHIVTERSVTLQRGLFHNRNTAGLVPFYKSFQLSTWQCDTGHKIPFSEVCHVFCGTAYSMMVAAMHTIFHLAQKCYMLLTYEANPMKLSSWLQ